MQNVERLIFVQAVKGNELYSDISRWIDELANMLEHYSSISSGKYIPEDPSFRCTGH
jgi:hypothetical protein